MRVLKARLLGYNTDGTPINYKEIAGLSTETKPTTGVCTGSKFFEVDTRKTNYFDETNAEWIAPTAEPVDTETVNAEDPQTNVSNTTRTTTKKSTNK